jgi:hypothetical protein
MIGPLELFLWGFFGSLATEIAPLAQASRSGRPLPKRYRRLSHWLARILVAVVGGLVAVAAQAPLPLLAVQYGVATPFLLMLWQEKAPGPSPGGGT